MTLRHKKGSFGFTLVELMIVVAVIAIISMIAWPSYRDNVRKSRRSDAQAALQGLAQAMERFYTNSGTYSGAASGGATGSPTVFATKSPIDGSQTFYNLTVTASNGTSYTLRATPVNDQVSDGILVLTSTGARGWDKNNDGDILDSGENCWETGC